MSGTRVLVAGIGGASLGTEALKALLLAGRQEVVGCDISPTAYGHFCGGFTSTHVVDRAGYVDSILNLCRREHIDAIVPGGEEPLLLLSAATDRLRAAGVTLCANTAAITRVCADKSATMARLADLGFAVPRSCPIGDLDDLEHFVYPCIVKPSSGSGGSAFVFLADDAEAANVYVQLLRRNGKAPVLQEYVRVDEGEFTVGVLSLPGGALVGSVAMRRIFDAKLSVSFRGPSGLISSGYSQGEIDDFPAVRQTCERIATRLAARGR